MTPSLLTERDRGILRSFASRVDPMDAGARNNLGVLYFRRGMVDDAVEQFMRALTVDPRMTTAQRNLEIASFSSGYHDRRIEQLCQQLSENPGDRVARSELADTWHMLGDPQRASDELGVLLRDAPIDVNLIRRLATVEAARGDLEAAHRWLEHALELTTDHASILTQLGEVAYNRGLNADARAYLDRAVQLNPHDAEAWYLLGFVLGDEGDHEAARAATRRAQTLNTSLTKAHTNLSLERFDAQSYARARAEKASRGIGAESTAANTHYMLGLAFRQKGYLGEALREYTQAMQRGEDPVVVGKAIAEVHLLRGDAAQAIAAYEALLADQPQNARLWNACGVAHHQHGAFPDAQRCYEQSVAADKHYAPAINNLGVAHFHAGSPDRAFGLFVRALNVQPGLTKAQLNMALLLVRQGDLHRALTTYREVLSRSAEDPVAWNGVGLVLSKLGRHADARNAFGRAIEARTGYAEAHYNLAFTLSSLGEYADALRETRTALELDPYYSAQKFELAIDLEYEDPLLEVSPDMSPDQRAVSIADFAFEPSALNTLFADLEGSSASVAPEVVHDPLDAARALLADGQQLDALHAARRALQQGASATESLLLMGEAFLASNAAGEALERFREVRALDRLNQRAAHGELRALIHLDRCEEAVGVAEWLDTAELVDPEALVLIARARAGAGQFDAARDTLRRVDQLAPDSVEAAVARGHLEHRAGKRDASIAAFRVATQRDATHLRARIELAALLITRGSVLEAETVLLEACSIAPKDKQPVLVLAALRREEGKAQEAIDLLVAFLKNEPYAVDVLAALGEALYSVCRYDDAHFAFRRVLRFDAVNIAALYYDGVLLARADRPIEALDRWTQVIELDPASMLARRARRDALTVEASMAGRSSPSEGA